ncbi:hypothetical protein AWC38_SpisGene3455 [Stylophora pistillata]|uniref:THAP-type domain-containing protein n=1 Tax=Stylophora pistillata TaxID=50429 RepID=A0A2B4SS26_STYPI|nr:hypothetical protein AWC38_SpisGene3455 [Stylophora pistillata]
MPNHARCSVGFCDNDKRSPDLYTVRAHVETLKFHKWPKQSKLAELWLKQVPKSRSDDTFNPQPGGQGRFVCSYHFPEGKRTPDNPKTDYLSLFSTVSDFLKRNLPKKRKVRERETSEDEREEDNTELTSEHEDDTDKSDDEDFDFRVPMCIEQITREADVKSFTGLPSTKAFKYIFDNLISKAQHLQYWRGPKQTTREQPKQDVPKNRPGPGRKLDFQQEFLITLMKLKLGLINEDLAFRFMVSSATVSSVFRTWIKLMCKELSVLIIWPSKQQVKSTLPACFKKLYPKVLFHVSPSYGGRTSDAYIVRTCGFFNLIEPYDEVMADRGFKIREDRICPWQHYAYH